MKEYQARGDRSVAILRVNGSWLMVHGSWFGAILRVNGSGLMVQG